MEIHWSFYSVTTGAPEVYDEDDDLLRAHLEALEDAADDDLADLLTEEPF